MSKNKKQQECQYSHEPFLDLSGKTDCKVNSDDVVYRGVDDYYGNLEWESEFKDDGIFLKEKMLKKSPKS